MHDTTASVAPITLTFAATSKHESKRKPIGKVRTGGPLKMTAAGAHRKRRLPSRATFTPLNVEPPRPINQELVLRGMTHSLGDIVRRDIAGAMLNAQSETPPRQIDRQTAEKALSEALLVSNPILRSRLVLAGLHALLMRLTPDFAPQAFANEVLTLLETRDTPARGNRPSTEDLAP